MNYQKTKKFEDGYTAIFLKDACKAYMEHINDFSDGKKKECYNIISGMMKFVREIKERNLPQLSFPELSSCPPRPKKLV